MSHQLERTLSIHADQVLLSCIKRIQEDASGDLGLAAIRTQVCATAPTYQVEISAFSLLGLPFLLKLFKQTIKDSGILSFRPGRSVITRYRVSTIHHTWNHLIKLLYVAR